MKKLPLLIIPVIIIAFVAFKAFNTNTTQPEGAYLFTGTAEATEVRLSFKIPGRISVINFDEGDKVQQGDLAAGLDKTDEKLAVSSAEANLAFNNAALAEVLAGSRKQEIKNAKAALDMAQAAVKKAASELEQAKTDKVRFEKLFAEKGVSERTYELYQTAYEKALHSHEEAKASETRAKETLSLTIEGARSEAIDKAKALVSVAEESLKQAQQKLDYTSLTAPISGSVISRTAEPGEFIQTGAAVLTIADIKNLWIRGYVSENYLGKVKLGQRVIIKSDSYPGKTYEGKISYISDEAEFTPKTVQTYNERINYMYMIKVTVDNSSLELKEGMPVDGRIEFK